MMQKKRCHPSLSVLVGLLISAGLAGCDQKKEAANPASSANALALPLTTGSAPPVVPAPPVASLPSAPPPRIARVDNQTDNYAYIDRAYEMSDAIGQAPPDYGFDFEGARPWAWHGAHGDVQLAEPIEGGYRYYYYQPGADEPYLVRDPQYAYGFSDGQLVAVYDNEGHLLQPEQIDQRIDDAGRYLARAAALYEASRQSERRSVNAANWAEQRAELDAARSRWEAEQSQQEAWRAYHAQHQAEEQAYWLGERDQREQSARSFDDWSSRGFSGPPPRPVGYAGDVNRNNDQAPAGQSAGQNNVVRGGTPDRTQTPQPVVGLGRRDNGTQQNQTPDQAHTPGAPGVADQRAQAQAAADAAARAQQQKAQADAARAQQQAQADAARQAQARAAADQQAQAKAQQQKAQADAARAQQQAQADAARQAQAKAAADQQAQARAAADAAARAQQQKAQADAARAQQQAQADAARAQRLSQATSQARQSTGAPQTQTPPAKPATAQDKASQTETKKANDDAHRRDGASEKPPAQ